ncbi:hypothetical protein H2200_008752 [Cladophialophora chaetospira]|uniref:Ankyrin repeat protein n=1 Tax=Cladophialophora chaetospira TaxID=386627 RepID=A0AA39CFL5_9EURO|nr:hypothetical protein H2200_008752 [Cladophialophora chaetospira]
MAEAVGLVSSIAQLVTVATQIAKLTYGYIADVRNASRVQKAYLQEVSALVDVLLRLEQALQDSETFSLIDARPTTLSSPAITECQSNLSTQHARLKKHINKLIWPFQDRDLRRAIDDVHRFRSIFGDFAVANTSLLASATLRNVDSLQQSQQKAQILNWLDPGEGVSKVKPAAVPGTGSWFVTDPVFRQWREGPSDALWCTGVPGVGKSLLASIAIDWLSKNSGKDASGVLYYFCDFTSRRQQTDLTILQSLLRQMLDQKCETVVPILSKHLQKGFSVPKVEELLSAFKEVCSQSKFYLVFDAPDKLDSSQFILSQVPVLVQAGCRVLVTSRDHPDVRKALGFGRSLTVYSHMEDMTLYILHRFRESDFRDTVVKGHTLVDTVSQKSNSLFLVAKLIMDKLLELPTVKQMRKSLAAGPMKLEDAYATSLRRIDAQSQALRNMARRLIAWVVHAERPLRPVEVAHAFATDCEDDEIDEENLVMVQTLLRSCKGLVVVDHDRGTFGMVHTTAYEFFKSYSHALSTSEDMAQTALTYMCLKVLRLGACDTLDGLLKRLEDLPFLEYAARNWGRHLSDPLLQAKLSNLITKVLQDGGTRSSAVQVLQFRPGLKSRDIAEAVFMSLPKEQTALHVAAYWGLQIQTHNLISAGADVNATDSQGWSPLHWAASGGHTAIIETLVKGGANINSRDSQKWMPLFWTSFRGALAALKLLLDHGANHLLRDVHGWSALHWAVSRGESQIVTALLKHHATYTSKSQRKSVRSMTVARSTEPEEALGEISPLELAVDAQDADLFETLLRNQHETDDKTLNISWTSGHFDPPTSNMWRVYNKAESMYGVEHYIGDHEWTDYGRKPNETTWKTRLLHAAIRDGRLSVMQLLIEIGADINFLRPRGALHAAAFREDPRFSQILLQHGADVSLRDSSGQTALHQAVLNGFENTISELLRGGSDVNAARERGRRDRLDMFFPRRKQLSITNMSSGMTPLMLACGYLSSNSEDSENIQNRIIALLLSYGGDPALPDEKGRTCLHYAPSTGSLPVTQVFIDCGVDINLRDGEGMTALHHAAQFGDLAILRCLVQAGADVNLTDKSNATPLHYAARAQDAEVLRELLEMGGQDVNHQDHKGVAIIHHFSRACNLDIIRLLVDYGARIDVTDSAHRSVMHYLAACEEGNVKMENLRAVFHLLNAGVDSRLLNTECVIVEAERFQSSPTRHTALSTAIKKSNWKLFHLMREAGAELPADMTGLLGLAIKAVQPDVVQHLIDSGAELRRVQDQHGRFSLEGLHLQAHVHAERLDRLLGQLVALSVDISECSNYGQTLLSTAAMELNSADVAAVLIKHGANPYQKCRGLDSIVLTAIHRNYGFLRGLLENLPQSGAEGHWTQYLPPAVPGSIDLEELARVSIALRASEQAGELKQTILTKSIMEKQIEFAELLIAKGLNLETEDEYGWTPLHHAVLLELHSVTKLLLEAGAKVDAAAKMYASDRVKPSGLYSGSKWTGRPLHIAVLLGDEEVTAMLLERGANVNTSTGEKSAYFRLHGPTPLHIALGTGKQYCLAPNLGDSRLRIAKLLIEKGANVDGVGDHLTPDDLKHFNGHEDLWEAVRSGLTETDGDDNSSKSPDSGI